MENKPLTIQQYLRQVKRCVGSFDDQPVGHIWSFNTDDTALRAYDAKLENLACPRYFARRDLLGFANPSNLIIDVVSSKLAFNTLRVLEYHLALRVAEKYDLDVAKVHQQEVRYVGVVAVQRDLRVLLDALDEFSRHQKKVMEIHDEMLKDAHGALDALVQLPK